MMKKLKSKIIFAIISLVVAFAMTLPFISSAAVLIDDTFADGNSQNQNLANNSMWLFNGRSGNTRTDAVGSVTFGITNSGSEAFWAFFTNPGSPVALGVGDRLAVSNTFTLTGFAAGGQDIRFGVLDSKGTRNTTNLSAGMNDATFAGDTGYAVQFFPSGTGNPFVIGRRSSAPSGPNNPFNNFADFPAITSEATGATARQTLVNDTPYTLTYTIERLTAERTKITVSVTGGSLSNLSYSVVETSPTPDTTFDYFAFRIGGSSFASAIKFTRLLVDYSLAPPVIVTQPNPAVQTVAVGSNVTMSIAATGNQLSYQWMKGGVPITGNPTATTPTLQLTNVQESDSGAYTCVVSNPGGSVTSNQVLLTVTNNPTEPAPIITQQPLDTTAIVGTQTSLSVTAVGNNLSYQWFKNDVLISGATGATLNFPNVQTSDAGNYKVVISNAGGSVTSNTVRLTVVSPMTVTAFEPLNSSTGVCTDAPLRLTFNQAPSVGNTGRIRVYKADGTLVDTIDMAAASQTKTIGGANYNFNYYPVIVTGNTASIYLHSQLAYNQTYYVTLEPGVVKDAAGAPFAGFSGANTWRFTTKTAPPAAGTTALTVAADGSGDFCTVQGAIDFVPANNTERRLITVKNGTYTEIVYINSSKSFITIRGENRDQTVVRYANNNNLNGMVSGNWRASFGVDAADFSLENITLHNTTPQGGSQAEALRTNGGRTTVNRVNLKSYQDTLLTQKSTFIINSYIEGDVDFMWGNGATFFKNTELKSLRDGGYYTQIRNNASTNGNVYLNCRLTKGAGVTTGNYLSRIDPDDFPYSQVVFINSQMDSHILPVGWRFDNPSMEVNSTNYPNIRFWEYNSRDLNGNPLDVSQRHPISRQLTAQEAAQWSDPTFVLGGWTPQEKLTALVSLSNLTHTYDGTAKSATATTNPAGLNVQITYNGSTTPPVNAGTYTVVATINDADYQGTATATMVINPAAASISLSNLNHVFDGNPKTATAVTTPAGVGVTITYNGSTTPPVNPGSYVVVATVNNPNYTGTTQGILTINPNRPKAFPGAEGYGAYAAGGRGGDVYHVTNLNDSGAGSLRNGIQTAPANGRTIVFDVSGTIYLQSRLTINKPNLTLAGQTAPGDGITVAGETTVIDSTRDVIVRYMRFRAGDIRCAQGFEGDSLWVYGSNDIMIDHVSASWSVDETLSVTESNRVTVQWSMITESLKNSCHPEGAHGYGSLLRYGNGTLTFHHNLYAHHLNRNPRIGDNLSVDFVNNVVYDWGINAGYSGGAEEGTPRINWVGNYFVAGPTTPAGNRNRAFQGGSPNTLIYQAGNLIDSNVNGVRDGVNTNWAMITGAYTQQAARFDFAAVAADDALTAYNRVLNNAGSSKVRDLVDVRVLHQIRTDTGTHIDSQNQVGGFPTLNSLPAPLDTDGDGMPDVYENANGLNPNNPADGSIITPSGYSNLEIYLNRLITSGLVTIGGRVTTAAGRGIANAVVTLTAANGATRTARTNPFGYYRFSDVQAGETYTVSVYSKRHVFTNQTQTVNVTEARDDVNFVATQ